MLRLIQHAWAASLIRMIHRMKSIKYINNKLLLIVKTISKGKKIQPLWSFSEITPTTRMLASRG